jgi:hypothetical protein
MWVVITGASSGQGIDFAIEFASRGFNILMIGSKRTIETEKIIQSKYKNVKTLIIYKDFRKAFENDFFNDIQDTFNNLNTNIAILINNVGFRTAWKPYHEMPSNLIRDTIATGTILQSRLTQMVIPFFLERNKNINKNLKSCLINITAQCLHPNFLFGITTSNEISVPFNQIKTQEIHSVNMNIDDDGDDMDDVVVFKPAFSRNDFNTSPSIPMDAEPYLPFLTSRNFNSNGSLHEKWDVRADEPVDLNWWGNDAADLINAGILDDNDVKVPLPPPPGLGYN